MKLLPSEFSLIQDILVLIISFIISIFFFYFTNWIKRKGLASQYFTRKLIHLGLAPIFLFTFILYSGEWFSPYIAVITPIIYFIAILLINLEVINVKTLTTTMSRSGDPKELLRGIAYYIAVVVLVTIFAWTSYPVTEVSSPLCIFIIVILAIGDGLADIVGRKMDMYKYKILAEKSIPGTLAMLISSLLGCFLYFLIFNYNILEMIPITVVVVIVATFIEAISPGELDNITVPLTTAIIFIISAPILAPKATWALFHLNLPG
jgi:dolichol kinase